MTVTNPFVSISGGTAKGPGAALDLGEPMLVQGVAVTQGSGTITGGLVLFEGSLDNSMWYPVVPNAINASGEAIRMIDGTYHLPPVARYLRANITTAVAGTGSTTATIGVDLPVATAEPLHSWTATFTQDS